MKRFAKQAKWESKINYVDSNNRLVGFDVAQSCCEWFGHAVCKTIPKTNQELEDYEGFKEEDLSDYCFVDEEPTTVKEIDVEEGGTLAFRLHAPARPDLFVVIWNHHNGYYSHGFETWREEGAL